MQCSVGDNRFCSQNRSCISFSERPSTTAKVSTIGNMRRSIASRSAPVRNRRVTSKISSAAMKDIRRSRMSSIESARVSGYDGNRGRACCWGSLRMRAMRGPSPPRAVRGRVDFSSRAVQLSALFFESAHRRVEGIMIHRLPIPFSRGNDEVR